MQDDHGEAWNSCPDDPDHSTEREAWGEDEWEAFLSRQDVLIAKYQELHETLREHPRCDDLIAREMHWSLPETLCGGCCTVAEAPQADACASGEDDAESAAELAGVPAYRMAHEFARACGRLLSTRLRERATTDEEAVQARNAAREVPARIAGGHCIGYQPGALCGNIACCRRAIASLERGLDGLLALRRSGTLTVAEADEMLRDGRELGEAIAERIEELRQRVRSR